MNPGELAELEKIAVSGKAILGFAKAIGKSARTGWGQAGWSKAGRSGGQMRATGISLLGQQGLAGAKAGAKAAKKGWGRLSGMEKGIVGGGAAAGALGTAYVGKKIID